MKRLGLVALVAAALGGLVGGAQADTMHPALGARLAGMGDHGVVNLTLKAASGRVCWTFDLKAAGLTAASIRDAHGMAVARLGTSYVAKGCASVAKRAVDLIESAPAKYEVWVDTKGHPGDLRGKLFAGMAHA